MAAHPRVSVNYRHAFHAGSFADVFKHAVLCRILFHLREKPAAFRVIDTHAGAGLYDLTGEEAGRSGEWHDGIARLMAAELPDDVAALLAPYLEVIGSLNESGRLTTYPGSPALVRAWLRPQDRLIACELEPNAAKSLAYHLQRDIRVKCLTIDGWTALSAYVPPKERRGLVLVDPPFERDDDFVRLANDFAAAHRKWPTGIYALWYPIKGRPEPDALAKRLKRTGIGKILRAELIVSPLSDPSRLNGSGLIIVNPPWRLEQELKALLPALAGILARQGHGKDHGVVGEHQGLGEFAGAFQIETPAGGLLGHQEEEQGRGQHGSQGAGPAQGPRQALGQHAHRDVGLVELGVGQGKGGQHRPGEPDELVGPGHRHPDRAQRNVGAGQEHRGHQGQASCPGQQPGQPGVPGVQAVDEGVHGRTASRTTCRTWLRARP
jgi:23S rRNA (adenine2030-N6)-methyltransferase